MADQRIVKVDGRFEAELLLNPRKADVSRAAELGCYTSEQADDAVARISTWPDYSVTPLRTLSGAAAELGIARLWCKDEGRRLGLASFKALGAVYASVSEVSKLLADRLCRQISDIDLLSGVYSKELEGHFLICCTDGNHGFSVANAARRMGCRAVIYIPTGVSKGREEALRHEGAEVVRIDGIYDEAYAAVEEVAKAEPGAILISDSATPYYQDIPVLCMTGYSVMAREILAQLDGELPTHLMLPAGCGGMAAAMMTAFHHLLGNRVPHFIIVEPLTADCVFASGLAGEPRVVDGDLETIMGGLSCAAVSHVAWPTISASTTAFLRMNDDAAVAAMRLYASPRGDDPRIVAGETGAAGLGGLLALCEDRGARALLGLDETAKVLVINCEGATDPAAFRQFTGQSPQMPVAV